MIQTRQWFVERGRNLATTTLHTRLNRLVTKGIVRRITENPAQYEAVIQRSDVSGRYFELLKELCGLNWVPLFAQLAEQQDFTAEEIDYLETIIAKKRQERN